VASSSIRYEFTKQKVRSTVLIDKGVCQDGAVPDGRLRRGAESRRALLRRGVDLASLDGLDGLSFGRLATELGVSKSGIQTHFSSKEELQLAVVEAARGAFEAAVVRPALAESHGVARLRALFELWLDYAAEPLFPGGCFWAANIPIFDGRPGPVRDALAEQQREWRGLLAGELRHAAEQREIGELDPDLAAFQLDAVLSATNLALQLGDAGAADRACRAVDRLLAG
jgi:AcrR family transcriptional regulator